MVAPSSRRETVTSRLYADYYDSTQRPAARFAARLFAQRYLIPRLEEHRRNPIFELGAGAGYTVEALRAAAFERVIGIDISASQVALAVAEGIDVSLKDARSMLAEQAPRSLGAVIALDVFEHLTVNELVEWVDLIRGCLMPDGVLAFRVPNGNGLFGGSMLHGDLTHLQAFTRASIEQLLLTCRMRPLVIEPCRPMVHGLLSAGRYALWQAVESLLRVAYMAESGEWRDAIFTKNVFVAATPASDVGGD